MTSLEVNIKGEKLTLLAEKAIYWARQEALLVSDLHLGKYHHFIANGVPLPPHAAQKNYNRLDGLIETYNPKQILILGDLFHSELNPDWEVFKYFTSRHQQINFVLVKGNHDIFPDREYLDAGLELHEEQLMLDPFLLTHKPVISKYHYNICGHVHPGVRLTGAGKQRKRLKCFYFNPQFGVLAPFGTFTGTNPLRPNKKDKVVAIADGQLIDVSYTK